MNSVCFQGKPFIITVIQVYATTTNIEQAEGEWFYEDLHDLIGWTLKKKKKKVIFAIGNWNPKERSQEMSGVTGLFGLGV